MKYTAYLSRALNFADEAIRVRIEDIDTFESFKQKVLDACKIADHRASVERRRLFEDTNLTDELSYEELKAARTMAEKLFPLETLPKVVDLGEKVQFEFSKLLAGGEELKLYISDFAEDEDLGTAIRHVWDLIDSRLSYTNKRELAASEYHRTLSISMRTKILNVMEILYGRAFKDSVIEKLRATNAEEVINATRQEVQAYNTPAESQY